MPFRPTDGTEISDEKVKALEEGKEPVKEPSESGREPSKQTPEPGKEGEQKVPFHQDPQVQLYIERQVAKRVGEGKDAYERRLEALEQRITQSKDQQPISIGGWTPGNEAEVKAAKAIILQAKREFAQDLQRLDKESREAVAAEDREFADWLGELRVTGVLKEDKDEIEFARLIAEYKLDDRKAAVALWTRLQEGIAKAKEEGQEEGIKKAQEAKIGSGRKGGEPGEGERTYQQRKLEEPSFDAILDRELTRLGH